MAASFVDCGKTVCDVGCDHGKLALYLVKEGRAEHVIATDIHKMPLQKAIKLFSDNGVLDKGTFLLTDGLLGVDNCGDISHVVIAGLGGETMAQVLQAADFVKEYKTQLVLLPAQSGAKIRKYLYENGFEITKETTVEEKNKYYTVICAKYSDKNISPDIYKCYIGESDKNSGKAAVGYFNMVLSQLKKQQMGSLIDTGECSEELSYAIEKIEKLIGEQYDNS